VRGSSAFTGLVGACALLALPAATAGQATTDRGTPLPSVRPAWMTNWSPLSRLADLPRELPAGARFPDLLSAPAPRVGEFWSAGNPGALARELDDRRAEFRFTLQGTSGDYARPFDPGGLGRGEISTLGWTRLGNRAAAIGSAVFDRTSFRDSLFSDVLLPYGSNPFMVADTVGDPTRRSAIKLAGALGWEFGRLGVGFAVGWEGQSTRTSASPVPRLDRTASPGLGLGLSYDLGGLRLGAYGRISQLAELIQVTTVAQASRIFQFEGYEEPIPLDLQPATYRRRFERDSHAWGASASFSTLGGAWALFGQRERTAEDQFLRTSDADPSTDRWDADGWNVGLAAQWGLGGEDGWLLSIDGRYRTLTGEAFQASIGGILFTVDESRLEGAVDLRGRLGDGWLLAGRAELVRSEHDRVDRLAEAASDIRSTQAGGTIEIARILGDRFGVSLGGRVSSYGPSGTLPDPATLGPEYRRFQGPGLALELTDATTAAGLATIRWQPSATTGVWLRGELGSLSPGTTTLPLTPTGSREAWRVTLGAVLDEAWPGRD